MVTENIQSMGNFTDGKYATGRRKKSIHKRNSYDAEAIRQLQTVCEIP